ncbi:biliverdin-producing heme oxygenase [uncultured Sphingobium sp.]|uniref:biliverdin-producing heme oxygenase n=1 Tax=uncultured Sphingobium sp. TaxID=316087 RepID=UPI002607DAC9|nr:biliverdin-producing heme oxygenase [uncultured Sphingobium sp.]
MTKSPDAGRTRQALREATMASHDRVDALFADFSLDNARDYADFLSAHSRALSALEPAAQPDQARMPFLAQDLAALGVAPPQSLSLESAGGDGYRWGLLYALEGSRLGGAFLARRVGPGLPSAYLSATHDKGEWLAFQRALDGAAAEGGEGWLNDAVQGALAAFALFAAGAAAQKAVAHG